MKVFVNWDPLLEEVVCVHTTEEGTCPKCIAINERAKKDGSYHLAGDWFEVLTP
jgi:hypothetical protein